MSDEAKGHVTIKDVAARACVSLATASRAFGGSGYVSAATRKRVHQAARELGYKPHATARSLKLRRTHAIGLVITDVVNPFYAQVASSVLESAKHLGYHVILAATDEDSGLEKEYLDVLMETRVDGILAVPTGRNLRSWREAVALGIEVAFVDRELKGMRDADVTLVDNRAGAYAATTYLAGLGHTRIGIINGPASTTTGSGRLRGYYDALKDAGLPVDPGLVCIGSFKRESGFEAARQLLRLERPPTALFAANNVLAESVLFAVREQGLGVPADISLVLFDDIPWASLVSPSLTVVAQPTSALGSVAATQLIDRLRSTPGTEPPAHRKTVLQAALIVRESCGPPRADRHMHRPPADKWKGALAGGE